MNQYVTSVMIRELREPYPDLKAHLIEEGRDVQKMMLFARAEAVRAEIAAGLRRGNPAASYLKRIPTKSPQNPQKETESVLL